MSDFNRTIDESESRKSVIKKLAITGTQSSDQKQPTPELQRDLIVQKEASLPGPGQYAVQDPWEARR